MNANNQVYEQVPASSHTLKVNLVAQEQRPRQESVAVPFEQVKHALSGKPLRRPNRTKATE